MAYTDQQVADYLSTQLAGASDREIAAAMAQFGVGSEQVSRATSVPVAEVQSRFEAAQTPSSTPSFADQDVRQYLLDRPGYTDAQVAANMIRFGVGPEQMARVTQLPLTDVQARYDAILGPLNATLAGGTTPTPTAPINTEITPVAPREVVMPTEDQLPGNVDMRTVMATPAIAPNTVPQMPTQMINPAPVQVGGALVPEYTAIPGGVNPLAVPQINVRNLINQGVVPNYVAKPKDTSSMQFNKIFTIGDRIF